MRAKILAFGDSITQLAFSVEGWVGQLAHAYSRKADVINRGYSGYNTRLALSIAPEVFAPHSTSRDLSVVTIFYGANDAASAGGHPVDKEKPLQHVPVEEYEANLSAIIALARSCVHSKGAVVVLAPPPLDTQRWPDRSNGQAQAYAQAAGRAAKKAAQEAGPAVLFADLFTLFLGSLWEGGSVPPPEVQPAPTPLPPWTGYLNDGLHLSEEGNTKVAQAVLAALPQHLQPDSLPLDFPIWREIPPQGEAMRQALSPQALAQLRAVGQPLCK